MRLPSVAVLAALSATACLQVVSEGPGSEPTVPDAAGPTCKLFVSTSALHFPSVPVAQTATTAVSLTGLGTGACTVAASMTNPAFQFTPALIAPIAPRAMNSFEISFTPTQLGPTTGFFKIYTNDPNTPVTSVALDGIGAMENSAGCVLVAIPPMLQCVAGQTIDLTLQDVGDGACVVNSYLISPTNPYVSFGSVQSPLTIDVGMQAVIPLICRTAPSAYTTTVTISDGVSLPVVVPLSG